jgi:hypothetical protein
MKNLPLVVLSTLGLLLVGLFWWGFAGFVEYGSSGSPPIRRLQAFWAGGVGYLLLLLVVAAISGSMDGELNQAFGLRARKNLKWTGIWLLACFPAAFLLIGFLMPPFILAGSAIALFSSSLTSTTVVSNER